MKMQQQLKAAIRRVSNYAPGRRWVQHVDAIIEAILSDKDLVRRLNDPVGFAEFLGGCFERSKLGVATIKEAGGSAGDQASARFAFVLHVLSTQLPTISVANALRIATVRDGTLGDLRPIPNHSAVGDVGWSCAISSSSPAKGRALAAVVRFMRPRTCLELGTCYGLSSMFLLTALQSIREDGSMTTVEGFEPNYSIAAKNLSACFGEAICCEKADVATELPRVLEKLDKLDFVFHDAGHSGEIYVRDFATLKPSLKTGAVVIIDDINWERWEEPSQASTSARCHEGWQKVVADERVAAAAEVDGDMGILLMR